VYRGGDWEWGRDRGSAIPVRLTCAVAGLGLGEEVSGGEALFARAIAGLLRAAEGHVIVDAGGRQVDHGHARLGAALEVAGVFQRLSDDARRQAELGAIGDGQGFFVVLDPYGRGDR